jgi:hypothetical protein
LATDQPSSTVPTTFAFGVRASVKKTSLNSASPVISRIGRTSMPGWSMGTRRNVMPLCFGADGFVRARTKIQLAVWADDVQIFWPLMTHSSPSSSARVPRLARSEPASGSL